jgi:hypothetical protein
MTMNNATLLNLEFIQILRFLYAIITYFQIHSFMQNKANLGNDKMNINTNITMGYVILGTWRGGENKANSNPIKPKTNPIKAKTNPIQTQTKPISNGSLAS